MTDDLPKVITIGRLKFKRHPEGWPRWLTGWPHNSIEHCDGRWKCGWQGPCRDTPQAAYIDALHAELARLDEEHRQASARIEGLLREAGAKENESQKQPIQIQTTEPPK